MMGTTEHPKDEALIAFFENPSAFEQKDLSLHLATCQSCRNQMSALSKLKETLKEITSESALDLADTKIEPDIFSKQDALNPKNLKDALHFETHRAAMDRALFEDAEDPPPKQEKVKQSLTKKPRFAQVFRHWLRLRTPFWVTVPTAVFAAIVFIFLFSPAFSPETEQLTLASYQDNAVMTFQDKTAQPGIGFFNQARSTEKAFENMRISLLKRNTGIALSWPRVENAIDYTLRLQIIQNGEKKMVDEITTKDTQALFKKNVLEKNARYEWILSGQTQDDKIFRASGGFILTQKN